MKRAISKENTHLGPELKFPRVVFAKTRPTCASKNAKERIVRSDIEEALHGCDVVEGRTRHAINKITRGKECFIPVAKWKGGMSEEGKPSLNQMTMLALGYTILL